MTERLRSGSNFVNSTNISAKMSNDLTPRKTMLILVIVVGCFAVLWPKVFYPMLVGSANQHIKPSPIDKTTGCCDVISEVDVNTIKIMSELCKTIIKKDEDVPLTGREIVAKCQSAVLETCGIDISAVLQEQVRLGQSVKQILDEIRSLNGSLCLKYNFGVAPWRLGVPHRVTVKMPPSSIRQERPLHLRSELVHPAFRERGRAIPQPQVTSPRTTTRVVEGRPGPIPGMRPTLGGAGHVVPPPKQGTGSMGLIMPIYTIGIVIFFTYTVLKIVFKKQPEALYPPVEPDPNFRREVFESERSQVAPKLTREGVSSKLVVNAMSALLDEVDQEIESRRIASEIAEQNVVANGNVPQDEEQSSVKVLGMETTASCEGGKKWSRPDSPVLPPLPSPPQEPPEPPQEIFLEGALPAQSHLLVADSATEAEKTSSEEDPAVVLAGKMTLSVISLDSCDNGTEASSNLVKKQEEEGSSSNVSEEFEKIEAEEELAENIETQPVDSVQQLNDSQLLKQIQNEIQEIDEKCAKLEDNSQTLKIENVENKSSLEDNNNSSSQQQTEHIESIINPINISQLSSIKDVNNSEEQLSDFTKVLTDDIEEKSIELEIAKQITTEQTNNKTEDSGQEKKIQEISQQEVNSQEHIENTTKQPLSSNISEPLSSNVVTEPLISNDVSEPVLLSQSNDTSEKISSDTTSEPVILSKVSESPIDTSVLSDVLETEINLQESPKENDNAGNVRDEPIQSSSNGAKPVFISKSDIEEHVEKPEDIKILTATDEKETFEKLNEAISDLSVEFRSSNHGKDELVEDRDDKELDNDDEQEIEYEYEDSDNEVIDDEIICDENRTDNELVDTEDPVRLNGENQEHSKYGTTSSATLAENEISDEEVLENENEDEDGDEEIEEIIEYITDEEEVVEAIILPAETNNTNHVSEPPSPH